MRKTLLLVSLLLALAGCEKPTIDASSDEALKSSMQKVRLSLPEERRPSFDQAVKVLALSQIDFKTLMASGDAAGAMAASKIMAALSGKNAEEVISQADQVIAERKAKEQQQALAEIQELERRRAAAEKDSEELKKVVVSRSRFYKQKSSYRDEPVIELTVKNGTSSALSRVYFEGVIASPNRSVPWLKDTFNYKISGGLEPGEQQAWRLAPNMFSDWGKVDAPPDAILTVTVVRVDGADEKPLFSAEAFGERESKRLAELKSKYNVQ